MTSEVVSLHPSLRFPLDSRLAPDPFPATFPPLPLLCILTYRVFISMPAPSESQRVPKWHIPTPLYSLPSTRHFATAPAVDYGYNGAWTGFHVIEELVPHPPGFRYVE